MVKADEDLLDSATSAMRAVTYKLVETKSHSAFFALSHTDLEQMVQFGSSVTHANVRINMINIIGGIGLVAASKGGESDQVSGTVANFLTEAAAKDTDLRVVTEALDKLFDMFTEDSTDELCAKIGLIPKLKQLLPGFRAKVGLVRKKRNQCAELNIIVDMANWPSSSSTIFG